MNAADVHAYKLVTCPYDQSHQIQQYRIQAHLEKCRKQHRKSNMQRCPFDATHIINEVEMDYHITVCPKREVFDRQVYQFEDTTEYRPLAEPPSVDLPQEEDWDDSNCTTYNPLEAKANNHHIIKKIKGATRSERRQARMEGVKNFISTAPGGSN